MDELERFYYVVEFPEEVNEYGVTSMSLISSTWVTESNGIFYCSWPTYFKNDFARNKAIREHQKLSGRTIQCQINIKYKSKSYDKAIKKLKVLESESGVSQSDTDDEMTPARKRYHPRQYLQDEFLNDFSSSDDLPAPPKLPKLQSDKNSSTVMNDVRVFSPTASTVTLSSSRASSISCDSCRKNEDLMKKLLIKFEQQSQDLKYLISLSKLKDTHSVSRMQINVVGNELELQNFNISLNDEACFAETVSSFEIIGGRDLSDTVRRILSHIMTSDLALKYNWLGRNNKLSFQSLTNVINMIIVAARKNPICKEATKKEVEDAIKTWLRTAGDRNGGRLKRKTMQ